MKARASLLAVATLAAGTLAIATASRAAAPAEHYIAHLVPMNSQVTLWDTTGEARFDIHGDRLTDTANPVAVMSGRVREPW